MSFRTPGLRSLTVLGFAVLADAAGPVSAQEDPDGGAAGGAAEATPGAPAKFPADETQIKPGTGPYRKLLYALEGDIFKYFPDETTGVRGTTKLKKLEFLETDKGRALTQQLQSIKQRMLATTYWTDLLTLNVSGNDAYEERFSNITLPRYSEAEGGYVLPVWTYDASKEDRAKRAADLLRSEFSGFVCDSLSSEFRSGDVGTVKRYMSVYVLRVPAEKAPEIDKKRGNVSVRMSFKLDGTLAKVGHESNFRLVPKATGVVMRLVHRPTGDVLFEQ